VHGQECQLLHLQSSKKDQLHHQLRRGGLQPRLKTHSVPNIRANKSAPSLRGPHCQTVSVRAQRLLLGVDVLMHSIGWSPAIPSGIPKSASMDERWQVESLLLGLFDKILNGPSRHDGYKERSATRQSRERVGHDVAMMWSGAVKTVSS